MLCVACRKTPTPLKGEPQWPTIRFCPACAPRITTEQLERLRESDAQVSAAAKRTDRSIDEWKAGIRLATAAHALTAVLIEAGFRARPAQPPQGELFTPRARKRKR